VDVKFMVMLSMVLAGLLNLVSRRLLRLFFSRTLYYDGRDLPPFFHMEGFPLQQVKLTKANVHDAVLPRVPCP